MAGLESGSACLQILSFRALVLFIWLPAISARPLLVGPFRFEAAGEDLVSILLIFVAAFGGYLLLTSATLAPAPATGQILNPLAGPRIHH